MPLIECTAGPTAQTVGGIEYVFQRDIYNRAVVRVDKEEHLKCFFGNPYYRAVDEIPEEAPTVNMPVATSIENASDPGTQLGLGSDADPDGNAISLHDGAPDGDAVKEEEPKSESASSEQAPLSVADPAAAETKPFLRRKAKGS